MSLFPPETAYDVHLLALEQRITALEVRANRVYPLDIPCVEYERQARWHATYNAAYPYVDAEPYETVRHRIELAHDIATLAADCAHGPLTPETPK